MEASGWERLTEGEIGSFSDGQGHVPSLVFDPGPNYGGGNEDNSDLLQQVPWHCYIRCPQPGNRPPPGRHWRLPDTYGQAWVSLLWSHCSLLLVHTRFCLCTPRVCFPVLCKFWWVYGGVNGYLLQEGLCHTQSCCTQSPCGSPLLTHTSSGDTQT